MILMEQCITGLSAVMKYLKYRRSINAISRQEISNIKSVLNSKQKINFIIYILVFSSDVYIYRQEGSLACCYYSYLEYVSTFKNVL